jgi:hypothetical protein
MLVGCREITILISDITKGGTIITAGRFIIINPVITLTDMHIATTTDRNSEEKAIAVRPISTKLLKKNEAVLTKNFGEYPPLRGLLPIAMLRNQSR